MLLYPDRPVPDLAQFRPRALTGDAVSPRNTATETNDETDDDRESTTVEDGNSWNQDIESYSSPSTRTSSAIQDDYGLMSSVGQVNLQ